MKLRCIVGVALAFLAGCATLVPVPALRDSSPAAANSAWARVLAQHVDTMGRTDYARLAREPADLHQFVGWLAANGPNSSSDLLPTRQHLLAHYLNAYNALAMYNVLEAGVPRSLDHYGLVRFFWLRELRIDGEQLSLYSYEKRIRALGEERIHFALNCMAAGCPRLPRVPFRAEVLDTDLDRETRHFFGEARNLQVDHARQIVRLTEIMRFFPEDFLDKAPSLIAYANRYLAEKIPDGYAVEFIPYDWTVAAQPPAP